MNRPNHLPASIAFRRLFFRLILCLGMLSGPVSLLTAKEPSPSAPPDSPPGEMNEDLLKTRRKQIEETTSLDEALRKKILEVYDQALAVLKDAEKLKLQGADYEKKQLEAPDTLVALRSELEKPVEKPVLEYDPADSLPTLEQRRAQAEADLKATQNETAELDRERDRRTQRRIEIPGKTTERKNQLEELQKNLTVSPPAGEAPELSLAQKFLLLARKIALENEIRAYEKEIASYDARGDLLTARRDQAARRVILAQNRIKAWQQLIDEKRRLEIENAAQDTQQAQRDAAEIHPALKVIADENARLAQLRKQQKLADNIQQVNKTYTQTTADFKNYKEIYQRLTTRIRAAGLTMEMSLRLQKIRNDLPNLRQLRDTIRARQSELGSVQVRLIEITEKRDQFLDIESSIRRILDSLGPDPTEANRAEIETTARDLLKKQRTLVDALYNDYDTYFEKLADLLGKERDLVNQTQLLADYINEQIFWIRSTHSPRLADLSHSLEAMRWFLTPRRWAAIFSALPRALAVRPVRPMLLLLLLLALLLFRSRWKARLERLGNLVNTSYAPSLFPTLSAFVLTVLLAAPWALLLYLLGILFELPLKFPQVAQGFMSDLSSSTGALQTEVTRTLITDSPTAASLILPDLAQTVAAGLRPVAGLLFLVLLVRLICQERGLALFHFRWSAPVVKRLHRNLKWLYYTVPPLVFLVNALEWTEQESWQNSLGRFAYVLLQLFLIVFIFRTFRPERPAETTADTSERRKFQLAQVRPYGYLFLAALPAILALLALTGYYYTAFHLAVRLLNSLVLVVVLILARALALRWILLSQRRLAMEQSRRRRLAEKSSIPPACDDPEDQPTPLDFEDEAPLPEIDLSSISAQTRNFIRTITWLILLFGLWYIWVEALPALRIFDAVNLWPTMIKTTITESDPDGVSQVRTVLTPGHITLGDLLLAILIMVIAVVAARNIPGLMKIAFLQHLPLQAGVSYAVTTITRYIITIIGLIIAFSTIGIGWSKIQWLAAAITVGLGFGLQEIFANFVSGLIILFERPIRIGDYVTVGNVDGKVTGIRIRATTITDWDRRELLVPNREFVTGQLINWTLSDPITRVVIPVGIAYGSDTDKARDLLLKIARDCPIVLEDPNPHAIFHSFGDSSLNFELRVFIPKRDKWPKLVHHLNTRIHEEFAKAGIEIAFPQRDLHIRSIKDILPIQHHARPRIESLDSPSTPPDSPSSG